MMTRVPIPVAEDPIRPVPGHVPVRLHRQRRIGAALGAVLLAAVLGAALSGSAIAWVSAAVVAVVGAAYAMTALRLRRLATEREMSLAFVRDSDGSGSDWARLEAELGAERLVAEASDREAVAVDLSAVDVARFVGSYVLGWLLTPVVVVVRRSGGRVDLRAHPVLARLVEAQASGRSQSLRLLAAGVVATAGIGAVGSLASATVASASPVPAAGSYTVRAGDTLGAIAARFGTTAQALASENGIGDPNLILPGQVLRLPASPAAAGSYTVRAGNTLGAIAARFGTTAGALASDNGIANPNLIFPGEVLHLSGAVGPAGHTQGVSASAEAPATYTVAPGDTLATIASRFATTVSEIAARNRITDPNLIYVGEVLRLTGGPVPAETAASPTGADPGAASPVEAQQQQASSGGASSGGASSEVAGADSSASPAAASGSANSPAVPADGESAAAAIAVKVALEQVGVPYVWGGASPQEGFDCSGLVMYAWAAAGVQLEHYTVSQYEETTRISASQLLPGDLVFYDNYNGPQPGHVAMYIGNGMVVSANETGTNVQTQSINYDGTIIGYGQVG